MTPEEFKEQMGQCHRMYFSNPEGAINSCHMFMSQVLVDLGYSDGVMIYKDMINDLMSKRKIII